MKRAISAEEIEPLHLHKGPDGRWKRGRELNTEVDAEDIKPLHIYRAADGKWKQGTKPEPDNNGKYNLNKIIKKETMAAPTGNTTYISNIVNVESFARFKGYKSKQDVTFTQGPSIYQYINDVNNYIVNQKIVTDEERKAAFKLFIHPTEGDAK